MDPITSLQQKLRSFCNDRDWDQFHSPKNLAMALSVESAELLEIFQWLSEEESKELTTQDLDKARLEIADVFIYLLRIADKLDIDLLTAADDKISVNERKYPSRLVKGSAKKYTEYD
jgi:NTP pyrophosphatase (non-canonical NTP hydrolase)